MPRVSLFVQSIIYGLMTKSVGSVYRVMDDYKAPRDVFERSMKREAALLALSIPFTIGAQAVTSAIQIPLFRKLPGLRPYELLIRGVGTVVGIMAAEATSRFYAPINRWERREEDDDEREEETFKLGNPPAAFSTPLTFSDTFARRNGASLRFGRKLQPGTDPSHVHRHSVPDKSTEAIHTPATCSF